MLTTMEKENFIKATIGLLVEKGRGKAAEKLKDEDVTDQKFRGLIVREIEDIKSQLKDLASEKRFVNKYQFLQGRNPVDV